jgi:hypothetical protein
MDERQDVLCIIPVNVEDRLEETRSIPYEPSPGMFHYPCERCGIKGWMGPKQFAKKREDKNISVYCMNCIFMQAQAQAKKLSENGKMQATFHRMPI